MCDKKDKLHFVMYNYFLMIVLAGGGKDHASSKPRADFQKFNLCTTIEQLCVSRTLGE